MKVTSLRRLGALGVVALMSISACGNDDSGSSPDETPLLKLVTYSSFVLDEEVKSAVESELGIELEIVGSGDAAEALNKAILTAGNPEGDVFFGLDNLLISRAISGDVFSETDIELPDDWEVGTEYETNSRMVPIDSGAVCVDYDTRYFEENSLAPPQTLEDLTDPAYKDLLVVQNAAASSPGLAFLFATRSEYGDQTDDYWQRLVDNGVRIAGSWDDAWYSDYTGSGGDRPLVVSYASSPPVEVLFSEDGLEEPFTGVLEETCFDQVEFAGVLRGTEHPELAEKLLEFMTGTVWQEALPLTNFVFPANPEAELPELFTDFAVIPDSPYSLDPADVDANRDQWVEDWRAIVE